VSDPTGDASSPEIWVVRAEHTKLTGGLCESNTSSIPAADVSGYDVLRISSSGTISRTTFASGGDATDALFSVRLDPGGRPLLVGTSYADNTKMIVARLNTNGTLDTTAGTNGFRTLSIGTIPAGAISVRASVMGIITTPETVYISVLLTDQELNSFNCQTSTPRTWGYRVAVISYADGFATNFGNGGIGERVTTAPPESAICTFVSGGFSVTSNGSPRIAYTTGTSFSYSEWAPPAGTTGGSDGGTGTGGYTKDTGGAPSLGEGAPAVSAVLTKLPSKINVNNAFKVLSAAQAKKNVLNSITPAVCFGAETYVIAVSSGTCTVRIKQISNGSVVRTLRSTVVKSAGTAGSAATPTALSFKTTLTKVTAANTATIAALASKLSSATLVVVSGHAASVTDSTAFNESIARKRALNVKAAILKTSSKAKVATVNLGVSAPVSTKKAESSQAKNRRAVIYIIS
jgi:outer membrane protein OmpA-like peptidoglycan-associated protein